MGEPILTNTPNTSSATSFVSREVWGPLVWRLFHGLADLSDRRDVLPLWHKILTLTWQTIPCEMCQKHMYEYWTVTVGERFLPKRWSEMSGAQVREILRERWHRFHNAVNARLDKPAWPDLNPVDPDLDRTADLQICQEIFQTLRTEWDAIYTIRSTQSYKEWKSAVDLLIRLIAGGPN